MDSSIPVHLKDIFMEKEKRRKGDFFSLVGTLRCACGNEKFRLRVCAERKKKYISVIEKSGGFGLAVVGECARCGAVWEIFDSAKHGLEAVAEKKNFPTKEEDFREWTCFKCGGETFSAEAELSAYSKEAFARDYSAELGRGELSESDWRDAFESIMMGLCCVKCGRKFRKWLDYECS